LINITFRPGRGPEHSDRLSLGWWESRKGPELGKRIDRHGPRRDAMQ